MTLAVVRSLGAPRSLRTAQEFEDFEQELIDQFALACAGAGITDRYISEERSMIFGFLKAVGRPLWEVGPADADGFLVGQRKAGLAPSTVSGKAQTLARFYDFLLARYQGDVHALTGYVLVQPIDEWNRPPDTSRQLIRVPPRDDEIDRLFREWREALPNARKFLPAARDYMAASLWRRVGLRISESVHLDIRDWRSDLGEYGKLHVRFGKGSRGRGYKPRMVAAIESVDVLMDWWLGDIRHQFGDDWSDPDAPLLPSERRDRMTGHCLRAGDDALRSGLKGAVAAHLPAWAGRLTPHVLRHYCASSLYARGMDLKAIQELLGHSWLSTTTRYIHVHDDHVETAWAQANDRVAARLGAKGR
ncbi:tyrosine-type recombinase/integrase [Thermomonospora umbrina]|uniref:Site-specific recombinase XerD n=1 Tax=Thermomonospora umbrina TaxID=111806 RepID=A0A3D9T791_9ACTN|nr:tyrosine-type recombinase/integrase [Thermomonospora umbrina]REF00545.1 site-specific recombinase XerD [Thermomonospora umbrina]